MGSVTGSAIVASWSLRGFGLVCSFGLCRLEKVVNAERQVIVATLASAFAALLTSRAETAGPRPSLTSFALHLYLTVQRCFVIPKGLMIARIGENIKVRAGTLLGTEKLLLPRQSRRVAAILDVLGVCEISIVLASSGIG